MHNVYVTIILKLYKHTLPHTISRPKLFSFIFFTAMSLPLLSKSPDNNQYEAIPNNNRHEEHHFESPEIIRDIVLGLSDGLTV